MPRSVFTRTLRDGSRSFVGFAAYIVLMVAAIVAIYPSLAHNPSLNKLVQSYPGTLKAFLGFGGVVDYSSAIGFLGIELFSLVLPGLMIAAAVAAGARAIAGEEEQATLDLLLANPISRRRLVLEKALALAAFMALLSFVVFASLAIATTAARLDISIGHLAAAAAATGLLGFLYGSIALTVGAARGRRGLALAVAGAAAGAAYVANALGSLVKALSPLREASPFLPIRSRRPAPAWTDPRARHAARRRRPVANRSSSHRLHPTRSRLTRQRLSRLSISHCSPGVRTQGALAQASHLSPARVALLWRRAEAARAASPTPVTCAEQDASGRDHRTRRARRDLRGGRACDACRRRRPHRGRCRRYRQLGRACQDRQLADRRPGSDGARHGGGRDGRSGRLRRGRTARGR
jgi:ABC-2 type transport system permease protein